MNEKNEKVKQTWTAEQRQGRVDVLKAEIKHRKKLTKEELYRFALKELQVSMRVIDVYMKELELMGLIECESKIAKVPVPYLSAFAEDVIIWKGKEADAE